MSHNGKLMPNLDEKSTKVLNLTVLQRIDPFVEEILITAAHVTFYEFNVDTSQWVIYTLNRGIYINMWVLCVLKYCLASFNEFDFYFQ